VGVKKYDRKHFANASDRETHPHHQERQGIIPVEPGEFLPPLERTQPTIDRQFGPPKVVYACTEIVRLYYRNSSIDLFGTPHTLPGEIAVESSRNVETVVVHEHAILDPGARIEIQKLVLSISLAVTDRIVVSFP
jgi:hypothetical protein